MTTTQIKHWFSMLLGFALLVLCGFFPQAVPLLAPLAAKLLGVSIGATLLLFTKTEHVAAGARDAIMTLKVAMKVVVVLLGACVMFTVISGCAAWRATKLPGDFVDCTTASAKSTIGEFEASVIDLIQKATGDDGTVDWSSLVGNFESFGMRTGACILADIDRQYLMVDSKKWAAAPVMMHVMTSYHAGFTAWRFKHAPNIKYRFVDGDI